MQKIILLAIAGVLAGASLVSLVPAEAKAASGDGQIMFILDASSSMLDKDGTSTTRIAKAKSALNKALGSIPADAQVGLRVYGASVPDSQPQEKACKDTQRLVAPATNSASKIKSAVAKVQAKGWTLMGRALQEVKDDFSGEGPKTVILLSDGIDTCKEPSACTVAKNLSKNGVNVKVNTLGLLVDSSAKKQLSCIAAGSGGKYYGINNVGKLESTLTSLTKQEVKLFEAKGQSVKGTLRVEDAPLLVSGKYYKDTSFTVPQSLFYKLDTDEHQKIKVIVKGVKQDYGLLDYLQVGFVDADTGEKISINYRTYESERFDNDVATIVLEADTDDEKGLAGHDNIAIKVAKGNPTSSDEGDKVPLEIRFLSEPNGNAPKEEKEDQTSGTATKDDNDSMSPAVIVLLTLLTVAVLGGLGFGAYKYWQSKKKGGSGNPTPPAAPTAP